MIGNVVRGLLGTVAVAGGLAIACDREAQTLDEALTDKEALTQSLITVEETTKMEATVTLEEPIYFDWGRVETVKRYSNGQVIELNRLHVNWYTGNEECKQLNPKYGNTTGDLLYDNFRGVLKKFGTHPAIRADFEKHGIFQQGFEYGSPHDLSLSSRNADGYWSSKTPFVRESTQDPKTLVQLGQTIRDNACNDVEQKTSFHQKFNPHMYSANNVLNPKYAPKTLGL